MESKMEKSKQSVPVSFDAVYFRNILQARMSGDKTRSQRTTNVCFLCSSH